MKNAIGSGFAGAAGVTLLNYAGRKFLPQAPRLDLLGMRIVAALLKRTGTPPPGGLGIRAIALAGELVSNTIFYGLVGLGAPKLAWARGAALGLLSGVGAATLPAPMGLGEAATSRTERTQWTTIAWYVAGGLLAALTYTATHREKRS